MNVSSFQRSRSSRSRCTSSSCAETAARSSAICCRCCANVAIDGASTTTASTSTPIMMSEKPENRMPRSQPARAASVVALLRGAPARDVPFAAVDAVFWAGRLGVGLRGDRLLRVELLRVELLRVGLLRISLLRIRLLGARRRGRRATARRPCARRIRRPDGVCGRNRRSSPSSSPARRPRRGWPPGHPRRCQLRDHAVKRGNAVRPAYTAASPSSSSILRS